MSRLRKRGDGLAQGPPVPFSAHHWASPRPASRRSCSGALTLGPTSQPGECGECARRGEGCGAHEVWAEVTVMGAEGRYTVWGSSGSDEGDFRGRCCRSTLRDLNDREGRDFTPDAGTRVSKGKELAKRRRARLGSQLGGTV